MTLEQYLSKLSNLKNLRADKLAGLEPYIERIIDRMVRTTSGAIRHAGSAEKLLSKKMLGLNLPATEVAALQKAFKNALVKIGNARENLGEQVGFSSFDFDPLIARASALISLPRLRSELVQSVASEIRRGIAAGLSTEGMIKRLKLKIQARESSLFTLANTGMSQFNNAYAIEQGKRANVKKYLYFGPLSPVTRDFCRSHVGGEYSLAQIKRMNNHQGLPVLTSCGGYNCQHEWVALAILDDEGSGV